MDYSFTPEKSPEKLSLLKYKNILKQTSYKIFIWTLKNRIEFC